MDIEAVVRAALVGLPDFLLKLAPSLAGAFFGALAAIFLDARRRKTEDRRKQYEAILSTQAILLSHGNSMLSISDQIKVSDDENPFQNLKFMILRFSRQTVDFGKLTFLGESPDPQLLLEIEVAQDSFLHFVSVLELRNKMLDEFFKHSGTEIKEFDPSTNQVRAKGDLRLIANMKQVNESTFSALKEARSKNIDAFDLLFAFGKKVFPKKRLLYISNVDRVPDRSEKDMKTNNSVIQPTQGTADTSSEHKD